MVLNRLLSGRAGRGAPQATLPEHKRVYAIGDVHGRADLLQDLLGRIAADHAGFDGDVTLVMMGDYIDRGMESARVLDMLLHPPADLTPVYLRGNHDQAMLDFLDDPAVGPDWFGFGGDATVLSYGVRVPADLVGEERYEYIRGQLADTLPPAHRKLLEETVHSWSAGDYFFAHAGVRPRVPLDAQDPGDLIWIRDVFLRSDLDHGKVVVHGHTPTAAPEIRRNRIGIDTGAYATGVLTALVLEGGARRFLATGGAAFEGAADQSDI